MKNFILIALMLISCGKKEKDSERVIEQWEIGGAKFESNFVLWQKIKSKYSSYSYYFISNKNINDKQDNNLERINIVVKDNEIICRSMIDLQTNKPGWSEKEFINSHKDAPKAVVIDDLYKRCTSLYLLEKRKIRFFYYDQASGESILEGCNLGQEGSYTYDDIPVHEYDFSKSSCD